MERRSVVARGPSGTFDDLQPSFPGVALGKTTQGGHGVSEGTTEAECLAVQQELFEVAIADLAARERIHRLVAELPHPKGGANTGPCGSRSFRSRSSSARRLKAEMSSVKKSPSPVPAKRPNRPHRTLPVVNTAMRTPARMIEAETTKTYTLTNCSISAEAGSLGCED